METLHDLAQATGGRILPAHRIQDAAAAALGRIVTDSRQVEPGDIFWALRGPNYDGACFIHEAFRRGAQGAVVSRVETVPEDGWILNVDDTQRALEQWARWKRRHFTGIVIAVTGSVGKTTTRQMIHTVLQSRLKGTASPRNYNNQWGVPLSMLAIEPQHDYAVLELGASRAGEIAMLAELCAPKVGVITQLGDAHLGGFGNRQGVAEAKAELLAALPASGHAVLADDSWLRALSSRCAAPITWIGTGPQCDLRAVNIECRQGRLEFHVACGEGAGRRAIRQSRQQEAGAVFHSGLGPPSCQRRAGRRGRGPHDGLRPGRNRRGPGQLPGRADALRSDRNPRRDDHQRYLQFEPHRHAGGAWNCCATSMRPAGGS